MSPSLGHLPSRRRLLALLACGLAVAHEPQAWAQAPGPLRVFAAASLKNAADRIAADFMASTGTPVTLVYGASSTLARQIVQGAPADVFVSADEDWMDYLEKAGGIDTSTRRTIVSNRLVLVAPASSQVSLTLDSGAKIAEALEPDGRLAIADPRAVPAGKYARKALENLGLWAQVERQTAPAENVRAALALVSRREAALGIVYESDQRADQGTRIVAVFPAESHLPILYPAAVTAGSRHPAARAFVGALTGPAARKILAEEGFSLITVTAP